MALCPSSASAPSTPSPSLASRTISLKNPSGLQTSGRMPPFGLWCSWSSERAVPAASASAKNLFSHVAMPASKCQGGDLDPGRLTWRPPFSSRALSCLDGKPLSLPSIWRTFDLSLIPQVFTECLLGPRPCTGCPGMKTPLVSLRSSGGDRCGLNTHKRR